MNDDEAPQLADEETTALAAQSERTFRLQAPHMRGNDILAWQHWLHGQYRKWSIRYPVPRDGDYDARTRAATASMCRALGLESAQAAMDEGVTPALRTKLRNRQLTAAERVRFAQRREYRRRLRDRFHSGGKVHTPLTRIIEDSWGYHPPRHDGLDLICDERATLFAICHGTVIRADASGWWSRGAPSNPDVRGRGDGIIVIRCEVTVGPFRRGLNVAYGHAEAPSVRVGAQVKAGDPIGKAGLANAWHIHFMVNGRRDNRGLGDRDPRPFVDYARANT